MRIMFQDSGIRQWRRYVSEKKHITDAYLKLEEPHNEVVRRERTLQS